MLRSLAREASPCASCISDISASLAPVNWQPCSQATSAHRVRQLANDVASRPVPTYVHNKVFCFPSGSCATLGRLENFTRTEPSDIQHGLAAPAWGLRVRSVNMSGICRAQSLVRGALRVNRAKTQRTWSTNSAGSEI